MILLEEPASDEICRALGSERSRYHVTGVTGHLQAQPPTSRAHYGEKQTFEQRAGGKHRNTSVWNPRRCPERVSRRRARRTYENMKATAGPSQVGRCLK